MSRISCGLYMMVLMVTLAITSCNRKTVYHHYEHTTLAGWEKNDTLIYSVSPMKQRAMVQENVELRISGDFPFRSVNLIVEQTTLPMGISRLDTLNCDLIDPEGNVKGDGISLYQYRFHLTELSLNEGDSLHIRIRHNMKREILPGIADIGIRLATL